MYWQYWAKVGVAAAVSGAAAAVLWWGTRPAPLQRVALLTAPVSAMAPLPARAIRWVRMAHPPAGALTAPGPWLNLAAGTSLPAGTILTAADLTPPQIQGLGPGEVQWLVTVNSATSGLPTVGERVDVWTVIGAHYAPVAYGVRVIGLYTSSGAPLTAASGQAPGLVALAVPERDIGALLAVTAPTLVVDPNQARFRLAGPPAPQQVPARRSVASGQPKPRQPAPRARRPAPLPGATTG